jgi:hypothetical protein
VAVHDRDGKPSAVSMDDAPGGREDAVAPRGCGGDAVAPPARSIRRLGGVEQPQPDLAPRGKSA